MSPRLILVALALLSQTGCVAAIPMAMQLASGANSTSQLCSMAKMPGQTTSLCDRFSGALSGQTLTASTSPATGKTLSNTTTAQR